MFILPVIENHAFRLFGDDGFLAICNCDRAADVRVAPRVLHNVVIHAGFIDPDPDRLRVFVRRIDDRVSAIERIVIGRDAAFYGHLDIHIIGFKAAYGADIGDAKLIRLVHHAGADLEILHRVGDVEEIGAGRRDGARIGDGAVLPAFEQEGLDQLLIAIQFARIERHAAGDRESDRLIDVGRIVHRIERFLERDVQRIGGIDGRGIALHLCIVSVGHDTMIVAVLADGQGGLRPALDGLDPVVADVIVPLIVIVRRAVVHGGQIAPGGNNVNRMVA